MNNLLDSYKNREKEVINQLEDESIDLDGEDNEQEDLPVDDGNRKLYLDKVDKSTSDLFRMIREQELILQPPYQRRFVWDEKIMSRFIESLLLGIPIPTIFLSENEDNTLDVIDGQQRLTTVFAFMKSTLSPDEIAKLDLRLQDEIKTLQLKGLETMPSFNGMKFTDLENEIRRRFNNVSLPIVIVQKDSTEDIKFDIFTRINQGSIKLNEQELRNVMYRGKLMDALNSVAELEIVNEVFGNKPVLKRRFGYQEIILRAKALDKNISDNTFELVKTEYDFNYGGRLNAALISYLKHYRDSTTEADNLKEFAKESFEKVKIVFGKDAFLRYNRETNNFTSNINKTVAELQLVVLSRINIKTIISYKEELKKSFINFSQKDNTLFTKSTNNTTRVAERYSWGSDVGKILNNDKY